MDNFAEHGIHSMVGLLFNGLFAADYIIGLDSVSTSLTNDDWLNHNWKQLYIQFAYVCACCAYVFFVTAALAKAMSYIPWLGLRASERAEVIGMDEDQVRLSSYPPILQLIMYDSSSSASLLKISSKLGGTSAPGLVAIRPPILLEKRCPMGTTSMPLVTATACRTLRRVDMSFTRRSLNYLKEMVTPRELARRPPSFASTWVARDPTQKLDSQPRNGASQGTHRSSTPSAPTLLTRSVSKSVSSCCGSSVVVPHSPYSYGHTHKHK